MILMGHMARGHHWLRLVCLCVWTAYTYTCLNAVIDSNIICFIVIACAYFILFADHE